MTSRQLNKRDNVHGIQLQTSGTSHETEMFNQLLNELIMLIVQCEEKGYPTELIKEELKRRLKQAFEA